LVRAAEQGQFDLITSPLLLAELNRALSYPKLRGRIDHGEAAGVIETVERLSHAAEDPPGPASVTSTDPGDAYLIALAEAQRAALVSGDRHLLVLSDDIPVFRPAEFLARLGEER